APGEAVRLQCRGRGWPRRAACGRLAGCCSATTSRSRSACGASCVGWGCAGGGAAEGPKRGRPLLFFPLPCFCPFTRVLGSKPIRAVVANHHSPRTVEDQNMVLHPFEGNTEHNWNEVPRASC